MMPAHAGRLRSPERCVFTLVFALMAGFVVVVAFMATTSQGHLLLTGPSVAARTVTDGLSQQQVDQASGSRSTAADQTRSTRGTSPNDRQASASGASAPRLDARLAVALRPVVGTDPGRLAVGIIDLKTGATASYDASELIRGGGVITADILAALLLQHQEAGTPVTDREAELAASMIENGSVPAAAQLWNLVGGARGLSAANATLKLRGTVSAPGDWTWTYTTVADQLRLLADLVEPTSPLQPAARDYALGLLANAGSGQSWGVLAAASPHTAGAVSNGEMDGPAWVVGSIGIIELHGNEMLVAVLSDRNQAQASAVTAVRAAALKAAGLVG